jgi:regulator of ribosome biosynthesis
LNQPQLSTSGASNELHFLTAKKCNFLSALIAFSSSLEPLRHTSPTSHHQQTATTKTTNMSAPTSKPKLQVAVEKPTPYTFDLGLLLASDPNPLQLDRTNLESSLADVARDGAQALINQLLTTCPITSTPAGVLLSLPQSTTPLPREKPLPPPKAETTWAKFAKKRGIKPKTREARKNLQYNPETGDWERKWGYKGANKAGENDWIVEVDPKKEAERKEGTTVWGDRRRERKERVKRNERSERKNLRAAGQS